MKTCLSILLGLVISCLCVQSYAQNSPINITGKIVESETEQAFPYATILAKDKQTKKTLAGTTSADDGSFSFQSPSDKIEIEITFMGFKTATISTFSRKNNAIDLGTIRLEEQSLETEEVLIQAEKSQTVFKLDKRIFNVGKDLSSTGASALEVLDNVPSVNVSIEGEVSLRGSNGVQILINGKPSVLASEQSNALGTLTAEMIDRIEVITNPSAKYEAEGTSGIINIVIKKDERKGLNGSISLNTGTPHNHSAGISLNRRTEKFNLFSQFGAGYRSLPYTTKNQNDNTLTQISLISEGLNYRNEVFYNINLGTDYYINPRNVITLSGSFAYEIEQQPSSTYFDYFDIPQGIMAKWMRYEETQATNPKWQYELQYKREFPDNKDHTLQMSALGNFFGKKLQSRFENTAGPNKPSPSYQKTETDFGEARYTFQVDYTRPFTQKITLESGGQYVVQDVQNDYAVSDSVNTNWVEDPGLTNTFAYKQHVLGVYSTGAYEGEKWGIKLGLRLENTDLTTHLLSTQQAPNTQNYTNLFPSVHSSYKFTERFSLQAGYSRRIKRPRLWDLNPFFNIRNNFSIRAGNPDLLPEFTDSYEINAMYILEKLSFNAGIFQRYTTDIIERVSFFSDNVNTFKPINIGSNLATGMECNAKYSPTKWLSLNGEISLYQFIRKGVWETTSFDFTAERWTSKLTSKFKLPKDIDLELSGDYRSPFQSLQGRMGQSYFVNVGLRKKLFKRKAVVSASVRDLFATRVRESEIIQDDFYVYSFGQRGRFITLGFSYGFGKGEAMQYTGRRR